MTGMVKVRPVILCGGSGTRLWPLSRTGFPKQFLCLNGNATVFQDSTMRLLGLRGEGVEVSPPLVVTNEEHRFLVGQQLREMGVGPVKCLLEPAVRNTAPALTLAALAAVESGEDPVLAVTPSDYTVTDVEAFNDSMYAAIRFATEGAISILGVTPDRPETGYGYIHTLSTSTSELVVDGFVEKPDENTARRYLEEGGYYWNAGIFVLKASVWLEAIEHFRSDIAAKTRTAWIKRSADGEFVRPGAREFEDIPSESIDYAVMERCPRSSFPICMVPLDAGWNDLGAWDSVASVLRKDQDGNGFVGDVQSYECANTIAYSSSRLVALVGVENLAIVETPDAVLVVDRSRSQNVKHIVSTLQRQMREEHSLHRKVHRPWGWYDSIDEGEGFKVKRIQVNPGASLSLQKHNYRSEHWVVVKGTAEISCGGKSQLLTENQSTYIPVGELHRLGNPGTTTLEVIEVQYGSYLGEDDIVRFEDIYGRG